MTDSGLGCETSYKSEGIDPVIFTPRLFAIAGALGIVAFLLVNLLLGLGLLLSAIAGAVVASVVIIYLVAQSRGETPQQVAETVVEQAMRPDPGAAERLIVEQLLRLNEQLRLYRLSGAIVEAAEALIDTLLEVVPLAQDRSPGSETTFDLEQLATLHLGKLIKEYADLSEQDRIAQQAALQQQLQGLQSKVQELKQHLDAGELHEFQVEHGFINQKF